MRHLRAVAVAAVTTLPGPALAARAAAQELPAETVAQIETRVRAVLESTPLPGLAVGVVQGEELVYAGGFGVADRSTGRAVTPETLFQIGSSSKSFTTTLFGILRDRGDLSFDDPLSTHLPSELELPEGEDGSVITLRHLATHTSGMPRQPPTLRRAHGDAPVLAFTHFELYQSIDASELQYPIGEEVQYSNFGFSILGHALERASGKPYETLLWDELLWPLGMEWTTVTLWPRHLARLALPYYPNARTGELEDYTPWDTEAMAPAGGITSSVTDLARYLSLHMRPPGDDRPRPIAAATLAELHEPRVHFSDTLAYGLGWFVRAVDGAGTVVEHGGEVDGYTSYLAFSPEHRVGVVILTNAGDGPLSPLGDWILARSVEALGR